MPPQKILLIRHGETDWNVEGRGQGFAPTELNVNGHRQAQALAAFLRNKPITALYSSDLPRTVQTAQPLAEALGIQPTVDVRWREINLGMFQGLTHEEAKQRYPNEVEARHTDFWNYVPAGGESRRQLQARAYAALQAVVNDSAAQQVAIISHGGTLHVLLRKLFGEHDERLDVSLTNTSITTIQYHDADWVLESIACTPHL